tara:strand:+ start:3900 stop:4265 length:366 start_codon:yes stop_codon:yes gene_type:complete
MSFKRKNKRKGANTNYSIASKLRKSKKSNTEFEIMLNNLSLEEIIGLKLELAAKAAGGKLYGIPLWNSLTDIAKDATFKYALSACSTKKEAALFLGIDLKTLYLLQKKYETEEYFTDLKIK